MINEVDRDSSDSKDIKETYWIKHLRIFCSCILGCPWNNLFRLSLRGKNVNGVNSIVLTFENIIISSFSKPTSNIIT